MDFVATHGTAKDCGYSIKKDNFEPSTGNGHWCGRGCYFFIDGINSEPIEVLAEIWAKDQAYDKRDKRYKYEDFSVLKAEFSIDDEFIFDFRIDATNKFCNTIRDKLKKELLTQKRKMNDDAIWEYIINKFSLNAIIKNDYIQFGQERRLQIKSRIPNCTITSIMNPKHCIDVNNIYIIKEGNIL